MRSVTANTRDDGRAFLAEAARLRPTVRVTRYPMRAGRPGPGGSGGRTDHGVAVLVTE